MRDVVYDVKVGNVILESGISSKSVAQKKADMLNADVSIRLIETEKEIVKTNRKKVGAKC